MLIYLPLIVFCSVVFRKLLIGALIFLLGLICALLKYMWSLSGMLVVMTIVVYMALVTHSSLLLALLGV